MPRADVDVVVVEAQFLHAVVVLRPIAHYDLRCSFLLLLHLYFVVLAGSLDLDSVVQVSIVLIVPPEQVVVAPSSCFLVVFVRVFFHVIILLRVFFHAIVFVVVRLVSRAGERGAKALALVTLAGGLGARAAADALVVATAHLKPLLSRQGEVALELGAGVLAVDEVAEAAADAALARVQSAARLAEVGDGRQLAVDGPARVPSRVELVACLLRRVLVLEARVHVAHQVVVGVVADDQLFELAVLAQLAPQVLVEGVEVARALLGRQARVRVVRRVLVHAWQQDRLRVRRLDVLAGAPVSVAARSDLVVEGAVDLVLLRAEDGSEEVGHLCCWLVWLFGGLRCGLIGLCGCWRGVDR